MTIDFARSASSTCRAALFGATVFGLAALSLGGSAAAQNLLAPTGWTAWNAPAVVDLQIHEDAIFFAPLSQQPGRCGIEQVVQVPSTGLYQLSFAGGGGTTGALQAEWRLDGQSISSFASYERRATHTLQLTAGAHTLRFTTDTSNRPEDRWAMRQPLLRAVIAPACNVEVVGDPLLGAPGRFRVQADADFVLLGLRRAFNPVAIPGLSGLLELDPAAGIDVLARAQQGEVLLMFSPYQSYGIREMPTFQLQAVNLRGAAGFGSSVQIESIRFQ